MAALSLYNSLTRQKESFVPLDTAQVRIYACGVTVYDHCHIGHARGAVFADILQATLQLAGYKTVLVKNYTDIDDKIISRAQQENLDWKVLSEQMIASHDQDMQAIFVGTPDHAPKATEHICEMIAMIQQLIQSKKAYAQDGSVLFCVRECADYGKLSGIKIDQLQSQNEEQIDFALWKAVKPGEPYWESPWGRGRPGWHIECSAMAAKYLGSTFDIHLGGKDLIFPHHENEIAQSESCSGHPLAHYWLHNGMVRIGSDKMSKSLGNSISIKDLLKRYHPEVIRFFLLSAHYRQEMEFRHDILESAAEGLDRIYEALRSFLQGSPYSSQDLVSIEHEKEQNSDFKSALFDDLNTPKAIAALFELTKRLNLAQTPEEGKQLAQRLFSQAAVLGIVREDPITWFQHERILSEQDPTLSTEQIEELIKQRTQARSDKNWSHADEIRQQLDALGIELLDSTNGTTWRRK